MKEEERRDEWQANRLACMTCGDRERMNDRCRKCLVLYDKHIGRPLWFPKGCIPTDFDTERLQ